MTAASVVDVQGGMRGRLSRVDALRAVAVLLVVMHHLYAPPAHAPRAAAAFIEFVRGPGWVGVDLFFVLSGFLVSGLLFREYQLYGDLKVGRFLIRRGFKIYPSFYIFLFATFFFGVYPQRAPMREDLLWQSLFVQNYADWTPGVWAHTWSLAVEEHFYFLLAAFMAWRLRPGGRMPTLRQAVTGFVVAASLVLLARIATSLSNLSDTAPAGPLQYFATHLRIDSLLFGVLLSYVYHLRPDVWARITASRWRLAAASVLLLTPCVLFPDPTPFTVTIGYTLYYLAFGAVLALALPDARGGASRSAPGLVERLLAAIGAYSYSIYLWHSATKRWSAPIWESVTGHELGYAGQSVLYFISSIVVGIIMAKVIEMPFLRWRDAAFPSRSNLPQRNPDRAATPAATLAH
jgi:peptidoglycan/LPS O-acetylase OafA/YrhL